LPGQDGESFTDRSLTLGNSSQPTFEETVGPESEEKIILVIKAGSAGDGVAAVPERGDIRNSCSSAMAEAVVDSAQFGETYPEVCLIARNLWVTFEQHP
jgi:hypothetical protein